MTINCQISYEVNCSVPQHTHKIDATKLAFLLSFWFFLPFSFYTEKKINFCILPLMSPLLKCAFNFTLAFFHCSARDIHSSYDSSISLLSFGISNLLKLLSANYIHSLVNRPTLGQLKTKEKKLVTQIQGSCEEMITDDNKSALGAHCLLECGISYFK